MDFRFRGNDNIKIGKQALWESLMHGENISFAYGFWSLVVINVGLMVFFILSFLTPVKKRDWRSMGVTTAFLVALFTWLTFFEGKTPDVYPALLIRRRFRCLARFRPVRAEHTAISLSVSKYCLVALAFIGDLAIGPHYIHFSENNR